MIMTSMKTEQATALSYQEVASVLQTNLHHGLNEEEAVNRKRIHGFNEFEISEDEPLWKKYLGQV